MQSRVL